jgi:hypothetical protein
MIGAKQFGFCLRYGAGFLLVSAFLSYSARTTRDPSVVPDGNAAKDAEVSVDKFGGLKEIASEKGGTGFFRLEKFGNRWTLVSPEGHPYWYVGVALVSTGNPGKDSSGRYYQDYVAAKYGGDASSWASQTKKRLLSWGFNGLGQDSSSLVLSYGSYGRQPVAPLMPHFNDRPGFAVHSMSNSNGYLSSPVKNFLAGLQAGMFPDVFDPAFQAFCLKEMAANSNDTTGGIHGEVNSPWVIGYIPDESDELTSYSSASTIHLGWGALAAAPTQIAGGIFGKVFAYTDHTVYTKLALRDFLKRRYSDDINALNKAWGSSYSGWGSHGTGSGLLDENGEHRWMGNRVSLSRETPAMQTDLNDFLFQIAKQYFQTVHDAIRSVDQNHLIFSPNDTASDVRPQILMAAKDYVDAFMANMQLVTSNQEVNLTPVPHIYNLTGKPSISASHFFEAIPDSDISLLYPHYPIDKPDSRATTYSNTQEQRGAAYAAYLQALLQLKGSDDVHPVLGYHWWALVDSWSERANFGLLTIRDKAYGGKPNEASSDKDREEHLAIDAETHYGDFISAARRANRGVMALILKEMMR